MTIRVLILGAAGRDFHDFNVLFRENPAYEVVGFTATQIPNIADRRYPPQLAGAGYPDGIPIFDEADLETLVAAHGVDEVVFSYSDVSHEHVMHLAARSRAAGAAFRLPGSETMLGSSKPVVAVTAARTGAGKSPLSRKLRAVLAADGKRVAVVRHPMPYGDLLRQRLQRFASYEDFDAQECTIEEREEYEHHVRSGAVVFAGVDYEEIVRAAEAECDVLLWDGGNNDLPFIRPDVWLCVLDPHRAGHELQYWPGEANVRSADVIVLNKVETAARADIEAVLENVAVLNPSATLVQTASRIRVDEPGLISGKRVLVVEDGPTLTHGGMAFGAGALAARQHGAAELIDPRPHAVGSIVTTFATYPHIGPVLPAMGYGDGQVEELGETIRRAGPDSVVVGTPIDLLRLLEIDVPSARVTYGVEVVSGPTWEAILADIR